jgi:phosphoribosylformylglycinamidine synthase
MFVNFFGREEGSNGDREMAAAIWSAGMQPWDVTMSDLLAGRTSLAQFRGAPHGHMNHKP